MNESRNSGNNRIEKYIELHISIIIYWPPPEMIGKKNDLRPEKQWMTFQQKNKTKKSVVIVNVRLALKSWENMYKSSCKYLGHSGIKMEK